MAAGLVVVLGGVRRKLFTAGRAVVAVKMPLLCGADGGRYAPGGLEVGLVWTSLAKVGLAVASGAGGRNQRDGTRFSTPAGGGGVVAGLVGVTGGGCMCLAGLVTGLPPELMPPTVLVKLKLDLSAPLPAKPCTSRREVCGLAGSSITVRPVLSLTRTTTMEWLPVLLPPRDVKENLWVVEPPVEPRQNHRNPLFMLRLGLARTASSSRHVDDTPGRRMTGERCLKQAGHQLSQ